MTRIQYAKSLGEQLSKHPRSYSFAELAAMSSPSAARGCHRRGQAIRLLHDRYVGREHADSFFSRSHAVVSWLGCPAALAGESALFAWGLRDEPPESLHVVAPSFTSRKRPPWLKITCASYDYPLAWWQGLPTVTPAFAIAQAYGASPASRRTPLVYAAINRRIANAQELADALATMPIVRCRRDLTRTINAALAGAESYLEEVSLYRVFNTKEFSHLIRQHWFRTEHNRFRLDLFDPATRTVIELDGAEFHDSPAQRAADVARDAELTAMGVATIRFRYNDVVNRPDWCREIVRRTLRSRSRNI